MADNDLENMLEEFYADDPQIGDIVFLQNAFEHCTISGAITGIKRYHPHRGLNPDGTFEVVVYHMLKLKVAGIKQWLKVSDDDWLITETLRGAQYNKLEPNVVLREMVEDEDE